MAIDVPHGCGRIHRGYPSLATCRWPEAGFVTGDGPWALIARCDLVSVALYPSHEEAHWRLERLDTHGCGQRCEGRHELVRLDQRVDQSEVSRAR